LTLPIGVYATEADFSDQITSELLRARIQWLQNARRRCSACTPTIC
jgi:hypothetical protein